MPSVARVHAARLEKDEHVGAIEVRVPESLPPDARAQAQVGLEQRRHGGLGWNLAMELRKRAARPHSQVLRRQGLRPQSPHDGMGLGARVVHRDARAADEVVHRAGCDDPGKAGPKHRDGPAGAPVGAHASAADLHDAAG